MSFLPPLEELDKDGAIQEAASKVDGHTRATFLKKAGVGMGALAGGSALVGALPGVAGAASKDIPQSDIDILNYALTLEYLEAAFYAQAYENGDLSGPTNEFARIVREHENTHKETLKGILGSAAVAEPKFDFRDTVTDQTKFMLTSRALEDTGVHAYLGQVPNIKTPAVLIGAGRILPVEARHASWIRDLLSNGRYTSLDVIPAPGAFEDGFTMDQVLAIVKGTGFIVG